MWIEKPLLTRRSDFHLQAVRIFNKDGCEFSRRIAIFADKLC